MIALTIPAALSLIIKIVVLWWAKDALTKRNSSILFGLLSIAMILNVAEIAGLYTLHIGENPDLIFRSYYVLLLFLAAYITLYCLQVSRLEWRIGPVYTLLAAIVACLLYVPGPLIDGYEHTSYSITAIKGSYYWVFRVALLIFLFSSMLFLFRGYRKAKTHMLKVQCMYAGISLAPLLLTGFVVLGLQAIGIQFNAMIAVPVATAFFVVIIAKTERKHQLTDIRRWLPGSDERVLANRILNEASKYSLGDHGLAEAMAKCEEILIQYKMDQHPSSETGQKYNVSAAANDMKIKRTTLYNKLEKVGIKLKG